MGGGARALSDRNPGASAHLTLTRIAHRAGVVRLRGEDEPVYPEEDEAADEVGDDGGDERSLACEEVEHDGEDRRRELPPNEVEAVATNIHCHL